MLVVMITMMVVVVVVMVIWAFSSSGSQKCENAKLGQ